MQTFTLDDRERTEWQGRDFGSDVSMFIVRADDAGYGPALHRHPMPETIVIQSGSARFVVGDEELVLGAGHIVVVPALVPHRFTTLGAYEAIAILSGDRIVTEWL